MTLDVQQQKDLALFAGRCRQCEIDRSRFIADRALFEEKVLALEIERDVAVRAVKGGTKWQRFKKGAKHIGIGLGIGFALGMAAKR